MVISIVKWSYIQQMVYEWHCRTLDSNHALKGFNGPLISAAKCGGLKNGVCILPKME